MSYTRMLLLACVGFFLIGEPAHAAVKGTWKSYTSKREVRSACIVDGVAWAVTSGGLFSYNLNDGSIEQFTTSEGLHSIDLTSIASDAAGTLWIGASDGLIHRYTPHFREWMYVTGIASVPNEPQKSIHSLTVRGDTLFILSDLGISIFSISRMEFGDTYRKFGANPGGLNGNARDVAMFQNKLWVATGSGIAFTPVTTVNPSEPGSWQIVNAGLPSLIINDFEIYHDTLFAATEKGVVFFDGSSWRTLTPTAGSHIAALSTRFGRGVVSDSTSLYFTLGNQLWKYSGGSYTILASGFSSLPTSLAEHGVLGSANNGILFDETPFTETDGANWHSVVPAGPHVNRFVGMAVDDDGVFWSGTGQASLDGFMSFDGTTWKKFTPQTLPEMGSATSAYIINIGANNSKWISTYGGGVIHLNRDNEIERIFSTANGLAYTENAANNTSFCVATGVYTDRSGKAWINVRSAADRNLLSVYSPTADTFRYINFPVGQQLPVLTSIITDTYGTKWFTSLSPIVALTSPGLVFYDESKRLARRLSNESGWGIITTTNDGLTDNDITALAVDLDGSLWVGTAQGGINIIIDPTVPYRILPYHPLAGKKINTILVDPLNQKWVATEQGVFVYSPDGTSIVDSFTTASTNGKLPSDNVLSLAMNRENGTIYFGTESGLGTLVTAGVTPRQSFGDLKLYPNPFLLPSTGFLTIDGLVESSTIKILSVSGNLVKELATPGGRVGFWDGTDEQGELAPSGIYIVTAYSKDGSAVGKGKIAVVRK